MRNAHLAEWILSLVTDPARARARVGDLLEESSRHGPLWFWATVSWTALSLLSRDLRSNPWRMARLAALGLFIETCLLVALALSIGAVSYGAMMLAVWLGAVELGHVSAWLSSPPWLVHTVLGYGMLWAVQFQIGRWLARRSPGYELAPCAAMTLLGAVVGLVFDRLTGTPVAEQTFNLTLYQIVSFVPLFAGAIVVRRYQETA
jgi:hypothetical protein